MKTIIRRLLLALALTMTLSACSTPQQPPFMDMALVNPPKGSRVLDGSTYAADALFANMIFRINRESPIVAASLVDLGDLDRTSAFGRLVANQIGSRLAQYGYRVIEARIRGGLAFRAREGEFMLTRQSAKLLQSQHQAEAALVGSYTATSRQVFVSVRLVSLADGGIISSYEYWLPRKGEVGRLLADRSPDAAFQRMAARPQLNIRRAPAKTQTRPGYQPYQPRGAAPLGPPTRVAPPTPVR